MVPSTKVAPFPYLLWGWFSLPTAYVVFLYFLPVISEAIEGVTNTARQIYCNTYHFQ